MDLLSSRPLREGSRGGRSEFSWEAVKNDKDRENYLGHSLMAPVGRWQQGKDLTWYAKDNKSQAADEERARRAEELRKIKEAEEDALARALGLPVKIRTGEPEKEVNQDELKRVVESVGVGDDQLEGKGVRFGKSRDFGGRSGGDWEKDEGQDGRERDPRNSERGPRRVEAGDFARGKREGNERGDRRNERRHRDSSRERNRRRPGRDRSRDRDRHGRSRLEDDARRSSRRHHEERGESPVRMRRSPTRSRSPESRRDRGNGRRSDIERPRQNRDNERRRDRSTDREHGRRR